jgi:class 3 adenylate cyclase/tetratricopeptide (TPR) repeat protein
VFVDISGFTKMSERLARHGKVGAEEVTDVLGAVFARLLAVAYANGGGLIKFGGDALLVWFSGGEHALRASRAAHGMRATLRSIGKLDTTAGRVTLRMSVGVNSGRFHFFLVGDSHREFIVTGPAATGTVHMEGTATAGEILLAPATFEHLPEKVLGAVKGPGRLLRSEPPGLSRDATEPEVPIGGLDLLPYVPVGLRDGILAGTQPEHRAATVAFVHFDGTDELIEHDGPEAAAAALDELVRDVQGAVDEHGVCFLSSDVDADGGKLILTAGVPRALGDDEERMLLALRRIIEGDRRIPVRIGTNKGAVFSGDVGPPYRRTYTVMGDPVNLAARLMAKAPPGEIYATASVLDRSTTRFDLTELEPFTVKGKAKPIKAWSVGAATGSRRREGSERYPLVGREKERTELLEALEAARGGAGRLVELVGEPGIGKTRLIEELRASAEGFRILHATAEAYTSSTPYIVWRELLREILDLGWEDEDDVVTERLTKVVGEMTPELSPWLPLLANVLDVHVPPTPEVGFLAPENVPAKVREVVIDLLRALLTEPTLIEIEDAHLMDPASAELLGALAAALPEETWLVVVTRREADTGFVAGDGPGSETLRLPPFSHEDAIALAKAATEEEPLLPAQLELIAGRSAGNPQLLLDLVRAVAAGSMLPDSVEAAAMVAIDTLAPDDRSLVRRASVLGLSFHPRFVTDMLEGGERVPDDGTWARLSAVFEDDGDGFVRFRRAIVRDAAYSGLPFRTRRHLHRLAGERLERELFPATDEASGILSLHFYVAEEYEKAWTYARTAGDRAAGMYANEEAARLYKRAVDAGRHVPGVAAIELAEMYEAMGLTLRHAGEHHRSAAANEAARRLARDHPLTLARLLHQRSILEERLGRYPQALRWATRARRILEAMPGKEAAVQGAQLMSWYAQLLQAQGRSRPAITWCERAIDEAKPVGDRETLWRAYDVLDWAKFAIGESTGGHYWRLGLDVAEEMGDLHAQATCLNSLGYGAYYEGRWAEALEFNERARSLYTAIGDAILSQGLAINNAEIHCERGNLHEAEAMLRDSLRVWRASGYRYLLAACIAYLARVTARLERFDEALELLEEALTILSDVGAEEEIIEVIARKAECRVLMGEPEAALTLTDEVMTRTQGSDAGEASAPLVLRMRGHAFAQLGRFDDAHAAFQQSLAAARSRSQLLDVALALHALTRLAEVGGAPSPPDVATERDALLERLGIEAVPNVPLTGRPVRRG